MAPTPPPPSLPPTHPLVAELTSLRQQIAQYRTAAHQAGIEVQSVRLELEGAKDEIAGLRAKEGALREEVDVLRTIPDPPTTAPPSNTLAELSIAHRRLSAKLDFTDQQLSAATLELASTRQELARTQKERDRDRAELLDLRRMEEDREEEIAWERGERKRFEEQKKLCDLALAEYAALVSRLDPAAVPPPVPRKRSDSILQSTPTLGSPPPPPPKGTDLMPPSPLGDKGDKSSKPEPEVASDDTPTETPVIEVRRPSTKSELKDDDDEDEDLDVLSFNKPTAPQSLASSPRASMELSLEKDLPTQPEESTISKEAERNSTEATPQKLETAPVEADPITPTRPTVKRQATDISISTETISNLLIGQRGVHRLFRDFSSTIAAKEKEIHSLQHRADELEASLGEVRGQLTHETAARVEAQAERDRALRDDASAAKVVERYMTFSQKAHETVHGHLGQLRTRSAATQASLRSEAAALRRRLRGESERAARLRAASEEMADELGKESAGRRREVALRLQLIAAEEARARKMEHWLDRVRRVRSQPDAAEPEALGALLDDGAEILAPTPPEQKAQGWGRRLLSRNKSVPTAQPNGAEDESVARVYLAEELVRNLVGDLQAETERRVELERQRVAWLAKEAEEGVPAETAGEAGGLVFDADAKEEAQEQAAEKAEVATRTEPEVDATPSTAKPATTNASDKAAPPESPKPPHLDELNAIFNPLEARYKPLQKSLHDQSVALAALRKSLPETNTAAPGKGRVRALVRGRTAQDDLLALLDGLHEVIEDARVDTEIAVADEDRVYHGFAALLGVGASGVVQATHVLRDAQAYAASRTESASTAHARLDSRVADIEHDLALIKRTLHEAEGMDAPAPLEDGAETKEKGRKRKSVWALLQLRTVTPTARPTVPLLALPADDEDEDEDQDLNARRRGPGSIISSMGRSLSSGIVGATSGVAGAPRRVTDFAGGLYRPRRGTGSHPASGSGTPSAPPSPHKEKPDEDDVE